MKSPAALLILVIPGLPEPQACSQAWQQVTPLHPSLSRSFHAAAYDCRRKVTVVFGGEDQSQTPATRGDTLEWDGTTWNPRPVAGPRARRLHALAHDSGRSRSVLFGGQDASFNFLGDTWEWDGTTWAHRVPSASPTARSHHAMAYDKARGVTVLFGGDAVVGCVNLQDTWEWDGTVWTQRFPATSPPARRMHAMAYDDRRRVTVLFGGSPDCAPNLLSDTWEWNGTSWINVTPPQPAVSPAPRLSHAMAYDGTRRQVILFGGFLASPNTLDNQTWAWNGMTWTMLPAGPAPSARHRHTLTYDASQDRITMIAGFNQPLNQNPSLFDAWELVPKPSPCMGISRAGPGHPCGGLALDCLTRGGCTTGGLFTLGLSDPPPPGAGLHLLLLSPGGCTSPPYLVEGLGVCCPALVYPAIPAVFSAVGEPGFFFIWVPALPQLCGTRWCLQGASFESQGCYRASDALDVVLLP